MVDFYEESFNFRIFLSFLLLGLFLSFIFIPLSFFLHSFGHGFFGILLKCQFIGVYLPLDNHSQGVLNYPTPIFSGTKGSFLYWAGGHLFVLFLILIVIFFPTGSSLIEMIVKNISGFYLAFFGGFIEGILAFPQEEAGTIPEILKINPYIFLLLLSVIFLSFSFYFLYTLISSFGRSFRESLLIPLYLNFSLLYFPVLVYLVFLFVVKGFVLKIHIPLYIFSTIFLLLSPLFLRGKKLWVKPSFTKPLYGFFILALFFILIFYFLFYSKDFPIFLWGKPTQYTNLPLEVKL